MSHVVSFVAGAGVGAGLMYLFDPDLGRRHRARAWDTATDLTHKAQDAAGVVARDVRDRAQEMMHGDFSALKRTLDNPLGGHWSPAARALMTALGAGLFLYGLTRNAPTACFLGTAGLALTAEGITNAGIEDVKRLPQTVSETLGFGGGRQGMGSRQDAGQPVGAGI